MKSILDLRPLAALQRLKPSLRRLWVQAFFLGALVRLALWVLPFRFVYRRLSPAAKSFEGKSGPRQSPSLAVHEVVEVIESAMACIPRQDWLDRALTAQLLLPRYGYATQLHIGIAKGRAERTIAHAWVEYGGEPLIGNSISEDVMVSTWRGL